MKDVSVPEYAVIGLLCGAPIAACEAYLDNGGPGVSPAFSWATLAPLYEQLHVPGQWALVGGFIFTVIVCACYGMLIGYVLRRFSRPLAVLTAVAVIIVAVAGSQLTVKAAPETMPAAIYDARPVRQSSSEDSPAHRQYFGMEAHGDLNGDGADDIAFIIHRVDPDRGILYYLTSALASPSGNAGTNLVFLGDGIKPLDISIRNSTIILKVQSRGSSSTTPLQARVQGGTLSLEIK